MITIARSESTLFWLFGWSCDNAIALICGSEKYFITDSRYTQEARDNITNAIIIEDKNLEGRLASLLRTLHIAKAFFDPHEWQLDAFERVKSKTSTYLHAKPRYWEQQRMVKRDDEIKLLSLAATQGVQLFESFSEWICLNGIGKSEYELQRYAKELFSYNNELSFSPIVAISENGAKPHALPTKERLLKQGDTLLCDAGIKYQRYCSDRTRTACIDERLSWDLNQNFSDLQIQKLYDCVRKAHDVAIDKARSGMLAREIDALARDIIDKAGWGKYFIHSTGHGVGLDIHEFPFIHAKSETRITDNMVFTIEPGIYLPYQIGIRIEDTIVMQNGRAVVL